MDDQAAIRRLLETGLGDAGAEVSGHGRRGRIRPLLESIEPELILLDLSMPGVTGWDVLESLRASGRRDGVPVILQTSADDFDSFDRARRLGVAAFISKPFRLGEVIETCRRVLAARCRSRAGRPGAAASPWSSSATGPARSCPRDASWTWRRVARRWTSTGRSRPGSR